MKHMPGPWEVFTCVDDTRKLGIKATAGQTGSYRIAYTAGGIAADQEIREANARLMAAAPDLLAALEDLLADSPGIGLTSACLKARAAIDKARGPKS